MRGDRPGGYAVQLLGINNGDGGAYFSLRVATGNADWTASETIRSTQQKTELHNQVVLTGYNPISYDMNALQNSSGGAFHAMEKPFFTMSCVSLDGARNLTQVTIAPMDMEAMPSIHLQGIPP